MSTTQTLRGMATVSFWADDLEAATKWYTELLGIEPYFEVLDENGRPGYREFRLGDYRHELGLISSRFMPHNAAAGPGGIILYWHVGDVAATLNKLLSMGAQELEGITERGEGFVTASVIDPFGNILGIMYNPHYLDVLGSIRQAK